MRRAALPSSGLYPLAVLSLAFLAYGVAAAAARAPASPRCTSPRWCSATRELPHRSATRSFAEGVAWLAQIGLFVMLGLLLSPDEITLGIVGLAVAAGLILTLVARPLSVLVSSVVAPMPRRELAFLSWAGLRGAVPDRARHDPAGRGVSTGAERLFDIVFVMVVIYTLLTGPTLPLVARWLRVARRSEPRGLEVEVAPLERIAADLLQVSISPRSRMHGVEVGELRLPKGASVSMVIRDGRVPRPRAPDRAPARGRPAGGDAAPAARADRAAAAPGQRGRAPGPVARRRRAAYAVSRRGQLTGGLQISASCFATDRARDPWPAS